ncbi:MAG: LytR C-terminal domain-containing protein [Actinobacteria bacterium]|nr:LytR C-terminal domain-containing protein [Actinomycetota bacterium]
MTALSPMGRVPRRRPVPPRVRRRRQTGPWLGLLGVLFVVTIIVWWKVLGTSHVRPTTACGPQATAALATLPAKSVQLRVYNGTGKAGLAKTVGNDIAKRGFKVVASANDPLNRTLTGAGEIRYGPNGAQQALLFSFQLPQATLRSDARTDAVIDFAIGPDYTALASAAQAEQAKTQALASVGAASGC